MNTISVLELNSVTGGSQNQYLCEKAIWHTVTGMPAQYGGGADGGLDVLRKNPSCQALTQAEFRAVLTNQKDRLGL